MLSDTASGRMSFSALQRAENSSIIPVNVVVKRGYSFSALQRAENSSILYHNPSYRLQFRSFSALQRAENSSIGGAPGSSYIH